MNAQPADDSEQLDLLAALLEHVDEASANGDSPLLRPDARLADPLRAELSSLSACVQLLNAAAVQGGLAGLSSVTASTPAKAGDSLIGERVGRYELLRELGHGGYGLVFLARDPKVGRYVALKLARPEVLVTPELRERFLREGEAARRLEHAYLLPVYEVGEDDALCYLVSPYCRGPSLGDWIDAQTGPIDLGAAVQLIACVAEAVEHVHRQRIVHRDITPDNVLLEPRGTPATAELTRLALGAYIPKLTDFGLAKLADVRDLDNRDGVFLGSPAYMAPEQADRQAGEVGPAADIYALGVVLYELLTGRTPFEVSDIAALRNLSASDPPRPRQLRRDVPRKLEAVVLRAIARQPANRYPSAAAFAEDLRRLLRPRRRWTRPARLVAGWWQRVWR